MSASQPPTRAELATALAARFPRGAAVRVQYDEHPLAGMGGVVEGNDGEAVRLLVVERRNGHISLALPLWLLPEHLKLIGGDE